MPDDSHRLALSSAMGVGGRSLSVEPPNRRRRGAPCPAPAALATVEAGRFEVGWFEAGKVEAGRFEACEGLEAGGAAGAGRLAPLGALVGNGVGGRSLPVEPPNRRRRGALCPVPAALATVEAGRFEVGWFETGKGEVGWFETGKGEVGWFEAGRFETCEGLKAGGAAGAGRLAPLGALVGNGGGRKVVVRRASE